MALLLYGVSPIGLGHAARAVAVGQQLVEAGVEVTFASGGPAVECLRNFGFKVEDVVTEPVPEVKDGEMKNAVSWYVKYWRGFRRSKRAMADVIARLHPDAVVCDEEFSGVSLALELGIPHALISDELELGFARTWPARAVERRVSDWYTELQRRVSLLVIPDSGNDGGNRRYVGPVVRRATKTRAQIIEEYGLPSNRRLILVALSGTGIGGYLVDATERALPSIPDSVLVVMGNRGRKAVGEEIFDVGVVDDGQNLVAAADVVVSTAGKSTIDEAASFGTPLVAIPIRNHGEQMRNASALGFSADDVARLTELIASRIGKRQERRDFDGAQKTALLIRSLLGS